MKIFFPRITELNQRDLLPGELATPCVGFEVGRNRTKIQFLADFRRLSRRVMLFTPCFLRATPCNSVVNNNLAYKNQFYKYL
jgi:hypothetical protein